MGSCEWVGNFFSLSHTRLFDFSRDLLYINSASQKTSDFSRFATSREEYVVSVSLRDYSMIHCASPQTTFETLTARAQNGVCARPARRKKRRRLRDVTAACEKNARVG